MKLSGMKLGTATVGIALLAVSSCITVNVYFPAADLEKLAEQIVKETYGTAPNPGLDDMNSSLGAFLPAGLVCMVMMSPSSVLQDDRIQMDISTPAIRKIRSSLKTRFSKLRKYFDAGHVGLTPDATIEIRETGDLDLKERGEIRRLVAADNKDREELYREIITANDIDSSRLEDVRAIFAKEWIDEAEIGWWYQDSKLQWKKKEKKKEK